MGYPSVYTPTSVRTSVIPYSTGVLADPQLWDRNFEVILLFGTKECLTGNANNIACSLQYIVTFIKQKSYYK